MKKEYKLRAECGEDIINLIKVMGDTFGFFSMQDSALEKEFTFSTAMETYEIINCLREVPDSHIMLETLMPLKYYTGKRRPAVYTIQLGHHLALEYAFYCSLYEWDNEPDTKGIMLYDFLATSSVWDSWNDGFFNIKRIE